MSIKDDVQAAMKEALRNKDQLRLDCLRMVKGALLMKEKDGGEGLTEETAVAALRSEVRKRQDSLAIFREHAKDDEADRAEQEIAIIEEFLPSQLSAEQVEEKVRAYLADHPEINHAGRLTGALKKELGDSVDGKVLNEVCRKVLG
jgi:uncharacterized protein YqeY